MRRRAEIWSECVLNKSKRIYILLLAVLIICVTGCAADKKEAAIEAAAVEAGEDTIEEAEATEDIAEESGAAKDNGAYEAVREDADTEEMEADATSGNGTISVETQAADSNNDLKEDLSQKVDLIMFMGQSNMSGCGGDPAYAPKVSQEAGEEFRAISDPTKLYPIEEPFGLYENNYTGVFDLPGGKKGSLVSAFIDEYYKETGSKVIAVSAAMGETSIADWNTSALKDDAVDRFTKAISFLESNGYKIEHKYLLMLQGESDGLEHTSKDNYRSGLDNLIVPFFQAGAEKCFIITPGRTRDMTEIYTDVINTQLEMCQESDYYALATSILCKVSTEYMKDIYHYNQHVLNLVGMEAAKSLAFYSNVGYEKVVYDYKNSHELIPKGQENQVYKHEDICFDLSMIDINNVY